MAHLGEQRVRLGGIDRKFEMFGGEPVAKRDRVGERRDDDDGAIGIPACAHRRRGAQRRNDRIDCGGNGIGKGRIVGEQNRLARRIMLGLAEQVGGDDARIVPRVGNDDDLARPGDHIDAHHAIDLPLRLGDPRVARAGDDVDGRDLLGAIGKRRHRLRAADPPDFIDPADMRRRHHDRVGVAARRRGHHHDAPHARDLGRQDVHQDR